MFERIQKSKLLFWSLELLIIVVLIFYSTKISFVFQPIGTFFSTLFVPILSAGFLFYLINPCVNQLEKWGIKRIWGILLMFAVVLAIIAFLVISVIPSLLTQIGNLIQNIPDFIKNVEKMVNDLLKQPFMQQFDWEKQFKSLDISTGTLFKRFFNGVSGTLTGVISSVTSIAITTITVPFILFYMLKDGQNFLPMIRKYLPKGRENQVEELLKKMSATLSSYIGGQMIECVFVGVCTFLGYMLCGIDYAFLFGCIAGVTNMVPYIGPYLGLAPALMVTVVNDPVKALLACIVVLVVQQVDGNLIYPNIIGRSLKIHPLTIIILLLVAGNIAGLAGMILGIPFYAVCKTVVSHVWDILHLKDEQEAVAEPVLPTDVPEKKPEN